MQDRTQPRPGLQRPPAAARTEELLGAAPPSANGHRRAAAFFDLDKTLMAGSSGIFFARAAYETGMISRGRLARDAYENLRFRLRGSTDERADDVRRRVGRMIAGVPVRDLQRLSPRVLAGVLPRRSEIVDGRYTGRPAGPFNYREGKVISMRELAEREGIDLGVSFAYSDSESDLPMLRAVGYPIVVNPDAELRRIALELGWEVLHLDRLGRRLKVLAALAAGGALASLGRVVRERGPVGAGSARAVGAGARALQSRPPSRWSRSARPAGTRRGADR
jgi:phosphoserine phosphatase